MKDRLNEECTPSEAQLGRETTGDGSEVGLRPGLVAICRNSVSVGKLRTYLFDLKDGLDVDPAIQAHILEGCPSCEHRRKLLEATTPHLKGWLAPKFMENAEMPRRQAMTAREHPQPEEPNLAQPVSTGASASTARDPLVRLAKMLASGEPLSLHLLEEWNRHVRLIELPVERAAFAREIINHCKGRWRLMGADLQDSAKTLAEQLTTDLNGGACRFPPDSSIEAGTGHDVRCLPSGLGDEKTARAFLVYMMARSWFLNADGDSVWQLVAANSPAPNVVLYFDVLRMALGMSNGSQSSHSPLQDHV